MSRIVIYGSGKTGLGLMDFLQKQGKTAVFYDDTSGFDVGDKFCRDDYVILSPGVPPHAKGLREARAVGAKIVSELEFCYARCPSAIISVTGTNGKTTTCEMIHKLLGMQKSVLLGNGGVPFSSALDKLSSDKIVVLESSSFQLLGAENFAPRVSLVTNVAVDHLNYHGTFAAYKKAKINNFIHQKQDDFALFNCDDQGSNSLSALSRSTTLFYSVDNPFANCYTDDDHVVLNLGGVRKKAYAPFVSKWRRHNVSDAVGAILAVSVCGCNFERAVQTMGDFEFLPHRLQTVGKLNGVEFVDDSKATNVHATVSALGCFSGKLALILGGSDKGEKFDELFKNVKSNVVRIYAVGQTARAIADCASSYGMQVTVCDSLDSAVTTAYSELKQIGGGTVLMSNACASFDKYRGYAQRGEHFARCVTEILHAEK